jgi:DNA-binding MarR family transcriptional regulator
VGDAEGVGRGDGVEPLDAALERLRHATSGFYGAELRAWLLAELGWELAPVHYRLLRIVEATEPQRPTVTEIGDALLTDKARASRLVDEVVRAGLVARRVGRLDRRRREVELSERGRDVMARARDVRHRWLHEALAGWPEAEVGRLADLLGRFNDTLRAGPAADRPPMVVEGPREFG